MFDTPRRVTHPPRGCPYGSDVGLTGVIFGGIAAAWLVYLVPYFLHHRGASIHDEVEPVIPFSDAVTIVRSGTSLAEAGLGSTQMTTP